MSLGLFGQLWLCRSSGYLALLLLFASQSLAPMRGLGWVGAKFHLVWRRRCGIGAALAASLHLALGWVAFLARNFWAPLRETPWIQLGLVAWILLLLLWLTSYPRLVKLLRVGHWRNLHRLAMVALLWALLHCVLAPWSDPRVSLMLFVCYWVLLGLRFVKFKPILKG